ncbi:flavin reductase [Erythrobacter sp. 3-20A1M]|nr:flavin reductase [Erythrobacter sp. 3-20A1M]
MDENTPAQANEMDTMRDDRDLAGRLRSALRRLPGPVSLITTCDPQGDHPAGMVASAVIPASMEPPSMLVAINRMSTTHGAVSRAGRFCINLLGTSQTGFVGLFSDSTLREERFRSDEWGFAEGVPYLTSACSNLFCRVDETLVFGTHEMFVGTVERVIGGDTQEPAEPLGWLEGDFAKLGRLD